jgi:CelD/BcsL family acetyltransferase involved in cellulose biosynthesis
MEKISYDATFDLLFGLFTGGSSDRALQLQAALLSRRVHVTSHVAVSEDCDMPIQEAIRLGHDAMQTVGWSVHRLPGPQALAGLMPEWEALAMAAHPQNPFVSPLWVTLWWKHFRRNSFKFRDEFFAHVVRDDSGRLIALAPLMRTYCPGWGPAVMRIVQFFGTDASLTEFRGVICRPEDHDRVISVMIEHFGKYCDQWDIFRWYGLTDVASAYNTSGQRSALRARDSVADYIVALPGSWDELRLRVSSNMRKNLRKAYESLDHAKLTFELKVVEHANDLDGAIARFHELHRVRADAAGMIRHPDKFTKPHVRAFLREYLHHLSTQGDLHIFELQIDQNVVATRLSFSVGSTLYLYFGGYDVAWKDYSIMTVSISEIIKWCIKRNFQTLNLSTGTDQSKLRWKPDEIILHNAVQKSPTARGMVAWRSFLVYEAIGRWRASMQ